MKQFRLAVNAWGNLNAYGGVEKETCFGKSSNPEARWSAISWLLKRIAEGAPVRVTPESGLLLAEIDRLAEQVDREGIK